MIFLCLWKVWCCYKVMIIVVGIYLFNGLVKIGVELVCCLFGQEFEVFVQLVVDGIIGEGIIVLVGERVVIWFGILLVINDFDLMVWVVWVLC